MKLEICITKDKLTTISEVTGIVSKIIQVDKDCGCSYQYTELTNLGSSDLKQLKSCDLHTND